MANKTRTDRDVAEGGRAGGPSAAVMWCVAALVGSGCSDEELVAVPSVIETTLPDYGVVLSVPDTVEGGAAFSVSFRTYGSSCIQPGEADDMEVRTEPDRVTFTPWDFQMRPADNLLGVNCPDDLRTFSREKRFRFATPGPKTVRMIGISKKRVPEAAITASETVFVR